MKLSTKVTLIANELINKGFAVRTTKTHIAVTLANRVPSFMEIEIALGDMDMAVERSSSLINGKVFKII